MGKWKALSVYETTSGKIGLICELLHKQQGDFLYGLFNEIEEALERSVQNHGKITFDWRMVTQIHGTTLSITFVPKLKVQTKKCEPIVATFDSKGNFKGVKNGEKTEN